MTKIIEQFKFTSTNGAVDVALYRDDTDGYGVEIISEDHGLYRHTFGNHSVECYNVAYSWFNTLKIMAEESEAEFTALLYPSISLSEDAHLSDSELNIIHDIMSDIFDALGAHPLNDIVLDDVRSHYKNDAQAPLWVDDVVGRG